MSEFQSSAQGTSASVNELQEEVGSLRLLLSAALIVMIFLSCSVNVYLLKQVSSVQKQIKFSQDMYDAEVKNFNVPLAVEYWNRLVQYSRTHQEYAVIINKYAPALNQTLLGNSSGRQ